MYNLSDILVLFWVLTRILVKSQAEVRLELLALDNKDTSPTADQGSASTLPADSVYLTVALDIEDSQYVILKLLCCVLPHDV